MAHDLLPIKETDKVVYRTIVNQGEPNEQEKDMEIGEKDRIWVENRHQHMKDTIEKLMGDFQKFIKDNPHFADSNGDNANSLNAIKDMLAGLPEFQELKEAYSLHLSMAQECMNIFQHRKLPDLASIEQANVQKLLAHAQLPAHDAEVVYNLDFVGARVRKPLKDGRPAKQSLFKNKLPTSSAGEEYALSRFVPALKLMLEEHVVGMLDQATFPYTKPQLDAPTSGAQGLDNVTQSSLRSAKPTWARSRLASVEPRQRIIVFVAGGATYGESRACYEVSQASSRDIFLATSHMLTPNLFIRQVGDLSVDRRRLDLPADRPKQKAPSHLFEQEKPLPAPAKVTGPPVAATGNPIPTTAMSNLSLNSRGASSTPNDRRGDDQIATQTPQVSGRKLEKGYKDKEKDEKKKKHHFFSSRK
ncbi:MAG: hypothetical protein M1825_005664 [Sarcosagium campestre]|nr:MAG: hypothetical protein M1825_005664 [Sarcosagium campestre]